MANGGPQTLQRQVPCVAKCLITKQCSAMMIGQIRRYRDENIERISILAEQLEKLFA
jgi:hypothetical protein